MNKNSEWVAPNQRDKPPLTKEEIVSRQQMTKHEREQLILSQVKPTVTDEQIVAILELTCYQHPSEIVRPDEWRCLQGLIGTTAELGEKIRAILQGDDDE